MTTRMLHSCIPYLREQKFIQKPKEQGRKQRPHAHPRKSKQTEQQSKKVVLIKRTIAEKTRHTIGLDDCYSIEASPGTIQ
ncbi:hypothetical protein SK128_006941, partial [Halocaridina rubra]